MHLLNLVLYCYVFVIVVLSLICPDPVKLNQGRFSLHVAVVIRFSHLKPDGELPEVITPQILSALLSNERFWVSQQFKNIAQIHTQLKSCSTSTKQIRLYSCTQVHFSSHTAIPIWSVIMESGSRRRPSRILLLMRNRHSRRHLHSILDPVYV